MSNKYKIAYATSGAEPNSQYVEVEAISMVEAINNCGQPDRHIRKCFKLNPTGARQATKDAAAKEAIPAG